MTTADIQRSLIRKWQHNRYLVVPRVYLWGWESDLVVVYPSGWVDEVEIKITATDLKNDWKKDKHLTIRENGPMRRMWYALPKDLRVEIPHPYGILRVGSRSRKPTVEREAGILPGRKIDEGAKFRLYRSIYSRFWDMENQK